MLCLFYLSFSLDGQTDWASVEKLSFKVHDKVYTGGEHIAGQLKDEAGELYCT